MKYLNTQILQLQQKVSRKKRLEGRICELRKQRSALQWKISSLECAAMKEEADVVRLEGGSLTAFYYQMIGKMEEKLDRERREALAARVKCDAALRQLRAAEEDLAAYTAELSSLALCEEHYRFCLEEKAAAIKASAGPDGLEILQLETQIQIREYHLQELEAAMDAGKNAFFTADSLLARLEQTAGLTTQDLPDSTQSLVEQLQIQLMRLRTGLADLYVDPAGEDPDGFSHFADFFFDGLFADWSAGEGIRYARGQVRRTRDQIARLLERLEGSIRGSQEELEESRSALQLRIVNG